MQQDDCKDNHECAGHDPGHLHGPDCGHKAVAHEDHVDYVVEGHLHHPHGGHCHNHGAAPVASAESDK